MTQEVSNALAALRAKLPCEFELPAQVSSGQVSYTKVNVQLGLSSGKKLIPNGIDCGTTAGWMYTPLGTPRRITLCADECAQLWNDANATVEMVLGCATMQ